MKSNYSCLYIIVPVFNEAKNLEELFRAFRSLSKEFSADLNVKFILVDDGSNDGTGKIADQMTKDLNLTLLTHSVNSGPGKAFATAFGHIASILHDDDWVVTMEGDNTSRLELMRQMYTRTKEGYDVVLASPYMFGGGVTNTSSLRVVLSHVANAFVKEFLGIHGIHTMSSFFRLYRGIVVRRLQTQYGPCILERAGFESMIELLLKMINLQTKISEVPMLLDTAHNKGKSKMKILHTMLGYMMLWIVKRKWKI